MFIDSWILGLFFTYVVIGSIITGYTFAIFDAWKDMSIFKIIAIGFLSFIFTVILWPAVGAGAIGMALYDVKKRKN